MRVIRPADLSPGDTVLALLLLGHVQQVAGLRHWPPLGVLIADVVDFAKGYGQINGHDTRRLATWARRWAAINPRVREFYERNSDRQEVGQALWAILDARRPPQGAAYGRLVQLWEEQHGYRPSIELVPQFP